MRINWLKCAGVALTGIASAITAIASNREISKEISKTIPKEVAKQLKKGK